MKPSVFSLALVQFKSSPSPSPDLSHSVLSARVVRFSRPQSGQCRPSRIRETLCSQRGLEGHHQSAQPPGKQQQTNNNSSHVRFSLVQSGSGVFSSLFQDYINCAEIWVEFTCRHFTVRTTTSDPETGIGLD